MYDSGDLWVFARGTLWPDLDSGSEVRVNDEMVEATRDFCVGPFEQLADGREFAKGDGGVVRKPTGGFVLQVGVGPCRRAILVEAGIRVHRSCVIVL